MKATQRAFLTHLMGKAWNLARQGAERFGGEAKLYFAIALRLVWQDSREKPVSVWLKGTGNQFLLPGLRPPVQVGSRGQVVLPGLVG